MLEIKMNLATRVLLWAWYALSIVLYPLTMVTSAVWRFHQDHHNWE